MQILYKVMLSSIQPQFNHYKTPQKLGFTAEFYVTDLANRSLKEEMNKAFYDDGDKHHINKNYFYKRSFNYSKNKKDLSEKVKELTDNENIEGQIYLVKGKSPDAFGLQYIDDENNIYGPDLDNPIKAQELFPNIIFDGGNHYKNAVKRIISILCETVAHEKGYGTDNPFSKADGIRKS